jgi:solute carrier family 35, member F1/2
MEATSGYFSVMTSPPPTADDETLSPSSSSYASSSDNGRGLWETFLRRRQQNHSDGEQRRSRWKSLLMGQFIAVVATSTNASTSILEYGMGLVMPFSLMSIMYIFLSVHLFYCEKVPKNDTSANRLPFTNIKLELPWQTYLLLSIVDVGPNYLTLMSLKYTSIASATLLLSLTVPSTMLFCRVLLGKCYQIHHGIGVVMCMVGGFLTLHADSNQSRASSEESSHPQSYFGDLLALSAAILFGLGDATGEYWTKHIGRVEYLGMIGLVGAVYSIIISFLMERHTVLSLFSGTFTFLPTAGTIIWYIMSVLLYYIFATLFYVSNDATLLNISLQASNLWAFLFSVLAYNEFPPPLFYLAVCFVVCGVLIYEVCSSPGPEKRRSRGESIPMLMNQRAADMQSITTSGSSGNYQTIN